MVAKLPAWPAGSSVVHAALAGRVALRIAAGLQRIQIFDRSMTIAAQLFTSVFPIIIMSAAFFGADATGNAAADAVSLPGETSEVLDDVVSSGGVGTFGVIGVLVVLVSATSLSRALTRAYDAVWQHGRTQTKVFEAWRWLAAVFVLALAVVGQRTLLQFLEPLPPRDFWRMVGYFGLQLAIGAFIPWLLMAGRIPVRWLLPGALLFAVVMSVAQPISARRTCPSPWRRAPRGTDRSASRSPTSPGCTWCRSALLACSVLGQVMVTDEGAFGRFLRGKRTRQDTPVPVPMTRRRGVGRGRAAPSGEPDDVAVVVDVDVVRGRDAGQPGHRHDVAGDQDDEAGAGGEPHLAHVDRVAGRRAQRRRGRWRRSTASWPCRSAAGRSRPPRCARSRRRALASQVTPAAPYTQRRDRLGLVGQRHLVGVDEGEAAGVVGLDRGQHRLGQRLGTRAAVG